MTRKYVKTPFSLSDDILEKGYLWGQFQSTIDEYGRMRLNTAIIDVLQERNISELWRFPSPEDDMFILCPPENRLHYLKIVKNHIKDVDNPEQAQRRYIYSGRPAAIDGQGRISILKVCLDKAKIIPPQRVTLLCRGLWIEVSAESITRF